MSKIDGRYICPNCNGSGVKLCKKCDGTGYYYGKSCNRVLCTDCWGGKKESESCSCCSGHGTLDWIEIIVSN